MIHHKGIVEMEDLGMSPIATNDIQPSTYTTTELSDAKASPFAGGVEGGMNYKTLTWWYVQTHDLEACGQVNRLTTPSQASRYAHGS